jgi:predicted ATPase
VLATSRERLGLIGERVMSLTPLALTAVAGADGSEAELLFVDRASGAAGVRTGSSLVSDICCHLDGMPLAIELAAARAGSLGLDGLLAGLDDHLRLLSRSGNPRDRHASMRTVIEWSHRLLDEDEATLLRRLGVFVGSFDLGAAVSVTADGELARTSDVIGRLADKSLLVRAQHGDTSRWRMLDTIRAYAGEQLEASGELPEVRGRHLVWAATTAAAIEGSLDDDGWQDRFDAVSDDLRAALRSAPVRCGDGTDFALALSLGHLSYARRFLVEARDHLDDAVGRAPDEASAVTALHVGASATYAEMRGEAAYHLLRAAHTRAMAAGDTRAAAIALADASALAGRCPALFVQPVTHEELVGLVAEARTLTAPDDLEAMVHLALAEAWDSSRAPSVGDLGRAEEALALTTRFGDPLLISSALDAKASAVSENGLRKEALRITSQRLALLSRLPRHDPRVGGEVVDIFHMACEGALGAGEVHRSLEMARSQHVDSSSRGLPHFAANHLVTPLMLQGEFDEALAQAAIMREGWERAGAPAAGWMAPSFFATAMIHGLRGDQGGYDEFWNLAMTIRMQASANSFAYFVGPRVALYEGALDRAGRSVSVDDEVLCGPYAPYAQAISVEVAVATGAPDAVDRLAAAEGLAEENDYAAAYLLRAAGRLHDDEATLKQAVLQWESLGARFERACTLLLLPEHATEGADELRALGCTTPPGLKRGRSPLA